MIRALNWFGSISPWAIIAGLSVALVMYFRVQGTEPAEPFSGTPVSEELAASIWGLIALVGSVAAQKLLPAAWEQIQKVFPGVGGVRVLQDIADLKVTADATHREIREFRQDTESRLRRLEDLLTTINAKP